MQTHAPEKYPLGKSRMEPLGVIVFAAIMGTCYAQVIVEAGTRLMTPDNVYCTPLTIALLLGVVAAKALLYMLCRITLAAMKHKSVSLEAQAEDHFNDCLTNVLSAVGTFFSSTFFASLVGFESSSTLYFIDPCMAALFSSYVIYSWVMVARENIVSLVGCAAPQELMQRITYLAAVHCSEVIAVDTIRCYSFGETYIAEVDIVLPPEMPNKQAHDIGESLQIRIEALEEIQRCFVHIDWETTHKPEHKS
jgi:cation diffusion facilitator family transporter